MANKPSPPPTGSLPTFFSGSMFSASLDVVTPFTAPTTPITKFSETKFNGRTDVGRTQSATTAFVAKYNHR